MIRLTIRLKKREILDSDLEKLRCAIEDLKKVIYEEMCEIPPSLIRRLRRAGIRGSKAGARLRRLLNKGGLNEQTFNKRN